MNDVTDQTLRHVLPFGKEYRKKSVKATSGAICYANTLPGKKKQINKLPSGLI